MADLMREYPAAEEARRRIEGDRLNIKRLAQPGLTARGIDRNSFDETLLRNALMLQKVGIQIGNRESHNASMVGGPVPQPRIDDLSAMAQNLSLDGRQPLQRGEMQQFNKRMGGLLNMGQE